MPKSVRTQLIEKVVTALTKIKAGNLVPNLSTGTPHTFLSSVRNVTRALHAVEDDKFPALYVVDPVESGRHMLADILQQTLQLTIVGAIRAAEGGSQIQAKTITDLDNLIDDTRAVLVSDPRWGGLSRRSRLSRIEADTSTDDNGVGFAAVYEIDYIEVVDAGQGSAVVLPSPLPVNTLTQPYGDAVLNKLFNYFLQAPGLVWEERAPNWPIPNEQIAARYTPGIWWKESPENYQYDGSTDTKKLVSIAAQLIAVDTNETTFQTTVDSWVAKLKGCFMSRTGADLGGLVATVDIQAIRTQRSEFPVVIIELDLGLMYVQSFNIS